MVSRIEPDIKLIKQIVKEHNHQITSIERVKKGVSTYVYRLGGLCENSYLRVLPNESDSFEAEVEVLKILFNEGVKVPEVIFHELNNDILNRSLMIINEIKGNCMEDDFPKESYQDILFDAGVELFKINQIKVDGFGFVNTVFNHSLMGENQTFQEYYHQFLSSDLSLLIQSGLNEQEIVLVKSYLDLGAKLLNKEEAVLVHGDFDTSHIFYHKDHYSGIIDFGDMMGNHHLYDLAHFKLHDGQYDNLKGFEALLKGYETKHPLSDKEKLELELLTLFIGVRRLGMIYGREIKHYSDFLLNKVKLQLNNIKETLFNLYHIELERKTLF